MVNQLELNCNVNDKIDVIAVGDPLGEEHDDGHAPTGLNQPSWY
jgi:hypothetical protein